jgi:hypothetical protein
LSAGNTQRGADQFIASEKDRKNDEGYETSPATLNWMVCWLV